MITNIRSIEVKPIANEEGMRYSLNLRLANDTEVIVGLYPSKTTMSSALLTFLDSIPAGDIIRTNQKDNTDI